MTETTALKTWGNSQGIIIPKKILKALHWNVPDVLELEVTEDEIRIRKPFRHKSFEERLAAYQDRIEVLDFDWGEPMGKELL